MTRKWSFVGFFVFTIQGRHTNVRFKVFSCISPVDMPRYCAVKACRNRGGTSSRQDNKRISFYPFPLQDKARLNKWVDNMRREDWTPSRHQYVCSEHFTEDCFDIRWGIRYLKHTAVPTIFPPAGDDGVKKETTTKRITKTSSETDTESKISESPPKKRPLILRKTCKRFQPNVGSNIIAGHSKIAFGLSVVSECGEALQSNLLETQTTICEVTDDGREAPASCVTTSSHVEPQSEEQGDSIVAVLCCEAMAPFSDGELNVDQASLQAPLNQTFQFVPLEMLNEKFTGRYVEETQPETREHTSLYEHSYYRSDTDKEELWNKIFLLHAKILELDRREERTIAKIQALENEIILLKREGTIFKEKRKILESYISSVLL